MSDELEDSHGALRSARVAIVTGAIHASAVDCNLGVRRRLLTQTCDGGERQLFLQQRHEFILAYYDMAQKDLDRHLKVGWQTITSVAGAVATISLAEQGFLPEPLAVSLGLAVSFWGLLNIIDSNYWSLRAIAFLANVESVYFYLEDRRVFNPYAGAHPSYKLLNSLRYQFIAAVAVILIMTSYFLFSASKHSEKASGFSVWLQSLNIVEIFMWLIPVLIMSFFIYYSFSTWIRRLSDYRAFVEESPGPGMVKDRTVIRGVEIREVEPHQVEAGDAIQRNVLLSLEHRIGNLESHRPLFGFLIVLVTALALILIWALR